MPQGAINAEESWADGSGGGEAVRGAGALPASLRRTAGTTVGTARVSDAASGASDAAPGSPAWAGPVGTAGNGRVRQLPRRLLGWLFGSRPAPRTTPAGPLSMVPGAAPTGRQVPGHGPHAPDPSVFDVGRDLVVRGVGGRARDSVPREVVGAGHPASATHARLFLVSGPARPPARDRPGRRGAPGVILPRARRATSSPVGSRRRLWFQPFRSRQAALAGHGAPAVAGPRPGERLRDPQATPDPASESGRDVDAAWGPAEMRPPSGIRGRAPGSARPAVGRTPPRPPHPTHGQGGRP